MRIIPLVAVTLSLFFATASMAGKIESWRPPSGMVWDTPSKTCNPTRENSPYVQGCYFGPVANPSDHAGLAFFQKCGPYRQMRPFLVADFTANTFEFFSDPSKLNARVEHGELGHDGDIDPAQFLEKLPALSGPCWTPAGEPV